MEKNARKTIEYLGRAGLTSRGLVYLLIAYLALQMAFGSRSSTDRHGALATLAAEQWGKLLLVAIGIGFAGYAAWRLIEGGLDPENKTRGPKGKWWRVRALTRGAIHAVISFNILRIAVTAEASSAGGGAEQAAAGVFALPLGRWLVLAAAAGVVLLGLHNGFRAATRRYRMEFKDELMTPAQRKTLFPIAAFGLGARGIVFILIGIFLAHAALGYDPDQAVGLDGALQELAGSPGGPWLLALVALGLASYGLFALAQARYREVMDS